MCQYNEMIKEYDEINNALNYYERALNLLKVRREQITKLLEARTNPRISLREKLALINAANKLKNK